MKRRIVIFMVGLLVSTSLMTACGKKNEATEASSQSEETEKEGSGESVADPEEEDVQDEKEEIKPQIAVLLPGSSVDRRWRMDADVFRRKLGDEGYQVMIRYATGNTLTQNEQILSIAAQEKPVEAMVIAPVDPWDLTSTLSTVSEKKIPVFSYDDLIMNTDAVSYYVTFDTRKEGQKLGAKIIEDLELEKKQKEGEKAAFRLYSFEPDDFTELFLYNGLRESLDPWILDTTLIETRTSPEAICTLSKEDAFYALKQLTKRGHSPEDEDWPDIYTVGNDLEIIQKIAAREITGTFFNDSRVLAEACADTILTYLKDETPEVSDYQQYDNGLRLVRSITCESEYVDQDDYKKLVDSGYYKESDITPYIPVPEAEMPTEQK